MKRSARSIAIAFLFGSLSTVLAHATTLDEVRSRGTLVCGVDPTSPGFSFTDKNGVWAGLNIDLCKAIAAAVGVEPSYKAMSGTERFLALSTGVVDILPMKNTWTMARDTKLGISFVATQFYEDQAIIVAKSSGVTKIADLNGASLCVNSGSSSEGDVAALFKERKLTYTPISFKGNPESRQAFMAGRCDFLMADRTIVAGMKAGAENPADYVILAEELGRSPLAISVRQGDEQWAKIVRWTFFGLLTAEFRGVTQANVDQLLAGTIVETETNNLLGKTGDLGSGLGLDDKFAYRAIKAVGNYGEIFDRNVGPNTFLNLERGQNKLWINGGLHYPPRFQ